MEDDHHHHPMLTPFLQKKQEQQDSSSTLSELHSILKLALPMSLTGLVLYSRSMISMLFLGRLGQTSISRGSLAMGFANITGYSVLSGLASGLEPICGQAFGAKNHMILNLALQQTVVILMAACIPISLLWLSMHHLLLFSGQDPEISSAAHSFILFSLPDLLLQSLLHPLRIYLRSQSITLPLTLSSIFSLALHLPINYLLVSHLHLGISGVALSTVFTNTILLLLLLSYILFSSSLNLTITSSSCFHQDITHNWKSLLTLSIQSCISVCLEWWWYEIMILLCGLLLNPKSSVASMGILIQTTSLIYIFPSSLSFSVSTRVANELGANHPARARRAATVGLCCGFTLGFSALLFALGVLNAWAGFFTDDLEILELTSMVLPILGACELGNCPQTTGCGVLRGTARPRAGVNINLTSFYGVGMPVAVVLAFWGGFGFSGLWVGLLAAQITCVVLMLFVVGRTDWDLQAQRAQRLTGATDVEDCSGLDPGSKIDVEKQPLLIT
ncbi:hypothetical protein J5N97_025264 [Dioscorea zingiberensis]|uniref:Protein DETOXIFICATION n=1 Tax=Dioscorea zingiberensis TaxID=325984 RepID=A0A9D5C7Z4_9LILI|nr:hypothetical protein J5N97_025264 [Dioscorea zingiberensis]